MSRTTVPIKPHDTTTLATPTVLKRCAAYGTHISGPRAPYGISHVNMAGYTSAVIVHVLSWAARR